MAHHFSPVFLQVSFTPQQADGECLAASTAMAISYLGVRVNYRKLNQILRIQIPYGTAFSNIQELHKLGLSVEYRQGSIADLHQFLIRALPCVVGVRTGQLPYWEGVDVQHVVLVIGMDVESIYLNDPAFSTAPIQVSHGDFDLAWFEQGEYFAVISLPTS